MSRRSIILSNLGVEEKRCYQLIEGANSSYDQLVKLRERFKIVLKSNRSLDKCRNAKDVFILLHKRDELLPEYLRDIFNILNISEIDNRFSGVNLDPDRGMKEIYTTICNDIGTQWKDFARELSMTEGQIDELQISNIPISEKTRKVLVFHQNKYSRNTWRHYLLQALGKCRRNDLRIKIEKTLDHYQITQPPTF